MLRKRTRSVQKDQNHESQVCDSGSESSLLSDGGNKNPKNSSFYTTIPGLLVGLTPKGLALADCDSVRSPTSPLELRFFSGLGNPFKPSSSSTTTARSVSSSSHDNNGQQKSKLGLVNILDDDDNAVKFSGKALGPRQPSESAKNILFGPKLRPRVKNETADPFGSSSSSSSSPKSLPKNYAIFAHPSKPKSPFQKGSSDVLFEIADTALDSFGKIRSCSLDSCRAIPNLSGFRVNNGSKSNIFCNDVAAQASTSFPGPVGGSSSSSGKDFVGSLSASEIELSEDYTCVISHGSNPKTTHIFGDCILETHSKDLSNLGKSFDTVNIKASPITTNSVDYPSRDFLSFCDSCNKKLEDGKDIYIYR